MWFAPAEHPLRRLFAGLTEHTFQSALGVADPPLTDYLAEMLTRLIHADALFPLHDANGNPIHQVIGLLSEASTLPPDGRTSREVHRQIGDCVLFWTGVFPEALASRGPLASKDVFLSYTDIGKRSYLVASRYVEDPYREEAEVLRRLSDQFELCAYGLNQVRREWEHHPDAPPLGKILG